jgi:hypothetical protein
MKKSDDAVGDVGSTHAPMVLTVAWPEGACPGIANY